MVDKMLKKNLCSIGKIDRIKRAAAGTALILFSLWLLYELVVSGAPYFFRLLLIIPLYLSFLTIYEAIFGFCVWYYIKRR